ncbi:C39 family peptidase [Marinobacter nanhaiticus D15-8W]|uniref:Peptidase C39 n=1 Tax=Marinobacter nanhaiticus D15-8W TaxID=626887 RepID=N6X408_9GAMM|nr:C39 family peptidase [Marinobacter nanhaiticus]ENO15808.1 peptidase C39 [Marinobacter nanhaiticus D15-8W]BES73334.1 C39 family peptidase [Marinobacter nanhaiticus D15-8W]
MGLKLTASMLLALFACGPIVQAGTVVLPGFGGDVPVNVTSFQERRFLTVIQQQYDFSCGSAAIASLLTYHYDHPVSEQTVFSSMLALADEEKVRRQGFSMLDMKRYLEDQGFVADGFRMALEQLREAVRIPLVVLLDMDGFRHFVIVKGISDREVLIGDPARGLKVFTYAEFMERWDGIAFVIRSHLPEGRARFNRNREWEQVARAPIDEQSVGEPSVGGATLFAPLGVEW